MITGWLLKIIVGFAVVGLLIFEGGSPLITKAQLDEVAHDAADSAALDLIEKNDVERARQVAVDVATGKKAVLTQFSVNQAGLHVTVHRQARSILLKNIDQLRDWYDVEATATASTVRR